MLIADVFDVVLIDKTTRDVICTTTLQNADIEVSVTENDVRGGKGNTLLAVIHASRDINLNLTDAEFRYDWLAKQLGQNITTGAGVGYAMPVWDTVIDGGASVPKITLAETPVATNSDLAIHDSSGVKVTGYSVTGASVDFTGATPSIAIGDKVEVRTYKYDSVATTESIALDGSVFATGVEAILETLEIDSNEVAKYKLQYQFDNTIPSGNFSISTASERQASTQQFNLRVIKPETTDVVGRVLRMPI